MPVLGLYTNVTTLSLGAGGWGCLAHGLVSTPDWAMYQSTHTFGAAVGLMTRSGTYVIYFNSGGTAVPGEAIVQYVHSIIR